MTQTLSLALILAAGKGTRMRSRLPKVLHRIAGAPMLAHVLRAVQAADLGRTAVIVGPGMETVAALAREIDPACRVFIQDAQLGTADAVLAGKEAFQTSADPVVVLYGDTPLLNPATLQRLAEALGEADIVVVGFEAANPTGYGRLILDAAGEPQAIREEKDASDAERALTLCNSGIMAFKSGAMLAKLLGRIGNDNVKGEFYLTDAVGLAASDGSKVRLVKAAAEEVLGVNSRAELAEAEAVLQRRLRASAMAGGATLIAPETVFLGDDTKIGKDVVIEPHVVIGPGVTIADNVTIRAFCHIEGATIGEGASVGPFARLRPGARLAPTAHVGNFVEVKQAEIGEGAKVNHLSYIGDASVGAGANIGAGTITCNYDGFAKHKTEIGAGAFIGSNSSLVAPVKIGEGAYIGSGSVISKDVPADALALTRAPQEARAGWAARFRARRARSKELPKSSAK